MIHDAAVKPLRLHAPPSIAFCCLLKSIHKSLKYHYNLPDILPIFRANSIVNGACIIAPFP